MSYLQADPQLKQRGKVLVRMLGAWTHLVEDIEGPVSHTLKGGRQWHVKQEDYWHI